MSTWLHSRDKCSQAFPNFRHSFVSMYCIYWTQTEGLGMRTGWYHLPHIHSSGWGWLSWASVLLSPSQHLVYTCQELLCQPGDTPSATIQVLHILVPIKWYLLLTYHLQNFSYFFSKCFQWQDVPKLPKWPMLHKCHCSILADSLYSLHNCGGLQYGVTALVGTT